VTAVQVLKVNQPSAWQKRFQSFDQQQQGLLKAAEPVTR
jgi:formate dehydrogenase major subunit